MEDEVSPTDFIEESILRNARPTVLMEKYREHFPEDEYEKMTREEMKQLYFATLQVLYFIFGKGPYPTAALIKDSDKKAILWNKEWVSKIPLNEDNIDDVVKRVMDRLVG